MLSALGYDFMDENGDRLSPVFDSLEKVVQIKNNRVPEVLKDCHFQIACDVTNPLCGARGCVYVFGAQKGVKEEEKEIIQEEQQEVEGTLKIGIIPTLAPYLLPVFIGPYIRKYPAVKVEVEELVSEEIIRRLKRDILDVGLFVTPYHDEKIVERPVFYEEMLVYAHPDCELLKKKEVGHEDIVTSDIWMLGNGHCFRNQVVNLCEMSASQHKNLPFEFESNSLETLMRIVDVEGGFTLIPELALQYMSPEKKKQVRSIANTKPLREVSVIYSRHFTKQRLITLLCDEIKSVVPAHMLKRDRGMIVEWKVEKNE